MKKYVLHSILFFGLFLMLAGCARQNSSMVNQSGIFTSYQLSYDAGRNSLSAVATFNFGGSTGTYLDLDGGSFVEFDNQPMTKDITLANQVLYTWTQSSMSSDWIWGAHNFNYKNNDGTLYKNTVNLPVLPDVYYVSDTIASGQSLRVRWRVSDTLNKDSLGVILWNQSQTEYVNATDTQSSTGEIEVPPSTLVKLAKGPIKSSVCRSRFNWAFEAPAEGGMIDTSSCSAEKSLQLN
jgi:hypothetical protein